MKTTLIFAFLILNAIVLKSQTTVYVAKDVAANKENYYYFEESTGKVYECFICKEKERKPDLIIKIEGKKIFMVNEKTEVKTEIGYLTDDKRIVGVRGGVEKKVDTSHADYIKDKKIYSWDNKLKGIIEGKEIYGAVADILGEFR